MNPFLFVRRALVVAVLAVAPGAGILATPLTAAAQSKPAGPFVINNTTGSPITLENMKYTDEFGTSQTITGKWEIKAGFFGPLLYKKEKIVARVASFELVTTAGRTKVTWEVRALDDVGDFVGNLTPNDLAQHRKLLGFDTPVAGVKPAPAAGPTEKQLQDGLAKVVAVLIANYIAGQEPQDVLEAIVVEIARKARDEGVQSALGDLFPQLSATEVTTARRTICLALDGRLTINQLNQARAKEELVAQLRKANPDYAMAAEVADFIYRVQQAAAK